jgi:hypothetical protein
VNDKKLKPIDCLDHNQEGASLVDIPKFLIDLVEQCGRFDEEIRPDFQKIIEDILSQPKLLEPASSDTRLRVLVAGAPVLPKSGYRQIDVHPEMHFISEILQEYDQLVSHHFLWNTDQSALSASLFKVKPHILHFSGHGEKDSVVMQDETRQSMTKVSLHTLNLLLKGLDGVILNCCHAGMGVEALVAVKWVIAFESPLADNSALNFTKRFYRNIFLLDRKYEEAFRAAIRSEKEWQKAKFWKNPKL